MNRKTEGTFGTDFWNGESSRSGSRNARLLRIIKNGNRADWDCIMLFYAIFFSDCIHSLNPVVRSNVDDLRRFRNDQFSHIPRGYLSSVDFQKAILNISAAFHALGLSVKSQIRQFSQRKSQEMF